MTSRFMLFALPLAACAASSPPADTPPLTAFRSVKLERGGTVVLRHSPTQGVTLVSGRTAYTSFQVTSEGTLRIDACTLRWGCPRDYHPVIEIRSPNIPGLEIYRGGQIRAEAGFPAQQTIGAAIRGGGQIDTRAVAARDVSAALSGGGQILVSAERSLNASVSGGGHVGYRGHPTVSAAVQSGVVSPLR